MTLTELIEALQSLQKEIGCNGRSIASHDIKSQVVFCLNDRIVDLDIELDDTEFKHGLELSLMPGCSCPDGVIVNLRVTG
jgi:hypothetical protein